eukprot:maker-scaffold167_size293163-snap-gene-1.25 protein:Tk08579 transcript:maker-scaffold167_size293163-snap-gene-1.25-mRNA-1 annotation:"short gasrtulation"
MRRYSFPIGLIFAGLVVALAASEKLECPKGLVIQAQILGTSSRLPDNVLFCITCVPKDRSLSAQDGGVVDICIQQDFFYSGIANEGRNKVYSLPLSQMTYKKNCARGSPNPNNYFLDICGQAEGHQFCGVEVPKVAGGQFQFEAMSPIKCSMDDEGSTMDPTMRPDQVICPYHTDLQGVLVIQDNPNEVEMCAICGNQLKCKQQPLPNSAQGFLGKSIKYRCEKEPCLQSDLEVFQDGSARACGFHLEWNGSGEDTLMKLPMITECQSAHDSGAQSTSSLVMGNCCLKPPIVVRLMQHLAPGRDYGTLLTVDDEDGKLGHKAGWTGTGRFYFRKKTLRYSFVAGAEFGRPKFVSFLDEDANIVEEFLVPDIPFQNITGKICGSWNRLPRRYRKQLRKDLLVAQVTNDRGVSIKGRIGKHYGLASEYFSGLLLPVSDSVGSASAIVSTSSSTGSIHVMILMSKIFGLHERENVNVEVKFEVERENGEKRIIIETLKVPKVIQGDVTSVDFKTIFDEIEMEALGRGLLRMSVASIAFPELSVSGSLGPRFSCDLIDGVLSPIEEEDDLKTLASPNYQDGLASGTIRMSANDVEQLFKHNLYVNVATREDERALRGKLEAQLMTEATQLLEPILLQSNQTMVSGIAWTNIDHTCRLNYQMRLVGPGRKTESTLLLKDFPMENLKNLAMMPGRDLRLQTFRGHEVSGHQDKIHKLSMARLDGGDASFVISHLGDYPFEIEGRIHDVRAPLDCLPRYARNELELMPGYLSDLGEERPEVEKELNARCLYEGGIYENGAQWAATHTNCEMCSCRSGKVICDPMVCPKTQCRQPIMLQGACCPICEATEGTDRTRGCQFKGDQQFHVAGSRWHPYIPPFGFSRCATCTCRSDSLQVECIQEQCPKLECPKEDHIREDALACCKTCKSVSNSSSPYDAAMEFDPEKPQDMGREFTEEDILAMGGCHWKDAVRSNGESWHPQILPYGEYPCVTCTCKDGDTKCQRKGCPKLTCINQVKEAKRARRKLKLRKLRRMREKIREQKRLRQERNEDR